MYLKNKQKISLLFSSCDKINTYSVKFPTFPPHTLSLLDIFVSVYTYLFIDQIPSDVELNYWKHVKYLRWKESKRWHLYQLHDSWTLKYENSSNWARGDEFLSLGVQYRGAEVGGGAFHFEGGVGKSLSLATIFLLLSEENGW